MHVLQQTKDTKRTQVESLFEEEKPPSFLVLIVGLEEDLNIDACR